MMVLCCISNSPHQRSTPSTQKTQSTRTKPTMATHKSLTNFTPVPSTKIRTTNPDTFHHKTTPLLLSTIPFNFSTSLCKLSKSANISSSCFPSVHVPGIIDSVLITFPPSSPPTGLECNIGMGDGILPAVDATPLGSPNAPFRLVPLGGGGGGENDFDNPSADGGEVLIAIDAPVA